jgi:hypothetical protein
MSESDADDQIALFAPPPRLPAGFAYRPEMMTPEEERGWAERLTALPFAPFAFHGYLGKRRVVSFGWRYDYSGRTLRDSVPIPSFLLPLRERAAAFADVTAGICSKSWSPNTLPALASR